MPASRLIETVFSSEGSEPISAADVKAYCSISGTGFDTLLTSLIKSARIEIEKMAQVSILSRTIKAIWSEAYECVRLPYYPVTAISSVTNTDEVNIESYKKRGDKKVEILGDYPSGLIVTYTAGFTSIPEDLKLAIIKKVLEDFEIRSRVSVDYSDLLPNDWRKTVINYRPTWLMF